jgi:hypothetical protein
MSKLFVKDPSEVIDIAIDWQTILDIEGSPDDSIATSTWTLPTPTASPDSDDIQIGTDNIIGNKTSAFFSSGVAGVSYRIKNVITTNLSGTFERHIYISVVETEPGLLSTGLVVEDGTRVTGANSYATREFASAYHAARDNSAWFDLSSAEMDAALIAATDYLTQKYTDRWKGIRISIDQALDWPRAGVITEDFRDPTNEPSSIIRDDDLSFLFPEDEVPTEVQQATAILALERSTGDLNPSQSRGGDIKRVKAGSAEVEWFSSASSSSRNFPAIESATGGLLIKYLRRRNNKLPRG